MEQRSACVSLINLLVEIVILETDSYQAHQVISSARFTGHHHDDCLEAADADSGIRSHPSDR